VADASAGYWAPPFITVEGVAAPGQRRRTPAEGAEPAGGTARANDGVRTATGSPSSHVVPQNTATTTAVATALCPRHRVSSATRTTRGSPASTVSGVEDIVLSIGAADPYDTPPMHIHVSHHTAL